MDSPQLVTDFRDAVIACDGETVGLLPLDARLYLTDFATVRLHELRGSGVFACRVAAYRVQDVLDECRAAGLDARATVNGASGSVCRVTLEVRRAS